MTHADREASLYAGEPVECYRFAHGAEVWRLTSAGEPHTLPDGTFTPEAISAGPIQRSREWTSGKLDVVLDYLHPVARLFQTSRPRQPVRVTVFWFHRGEAEVIVKFRGEVAKASSAGRQIKLDCVPSWYRLKKRAPQLIYSSTCPLALYGPRCGVDRTAFGERMGIPTIVGPALTAPALGGQADGWWVNGYVQTLPGETRFIIAHTGDTIQLEYALDLEPGQQVDVYPGCDRTEATCRDKFDNLPNHLGFARIPVRELFGQSLE